MKKRVLLALLVSAMTLTAVSYTHLAISESVGMVDQNEHAVFR